MNEQEKLRISEMRKAGHGYKQIANMLNRSESTIKSFCRRHGLLDNTIVKLEPVNACQHCGAATRPRIGEQPKRFCSDQCRYRWWNEHRQMRQSTSIKERVCPVCHTSFRAYGDERRYCSRQCHINARYGKEKYTHEQ